MLRGILVLLLLFDMTAAAAATDPSQDKPIDVVMQLGTKDEDRVFTPSKETFEAGKLYRLVLMNITSETHHFSAPGFAAAVWSSKVETKSAEIKGSIREIEVKGGGRAEWFFVPVKTGSYRLECTIPGHAKAGMTGTLLIK